MNCSRDCNSGSDLDGDDSDGSDSDCSDTSDSSDSDDDDDEDEDNDEDEDDEDSTVHIIVDPQNMLTSSVTSLMNSEPFLLALHDLEVAVQIHTRVAHVQCGRSN